MEPGHEDREYGRMLRHQHRRLVASMEPGHEDREYSEVLPSGLVTVSASMEPGHEDREYQVGAGVRVGPRARLNGARS